ncbi:MAG: DUF2905 family protein [Bdellovibrionales bacterium]|nr:DUF2905 family protein [Bdellovibrionales bacterium]
MNHQSIGTLLLAIGAILLMAGGVVYFFGDKLKWIGHLPGDISYQGGNFSFYFPLTTLLLVNAVIWILIKISS